jgi:hypothetical protein
MPPSVTIVLFTVYLERAMSFHTVLNYKNKYSNVDNAVLLVDEVKMGVLYHRYAAHNSNT